MTKCKYTHNGKENCNLYISKEDLFPDFCYFHQIGGLFNSCQKVLKDKHSEINQDNLTQGACNTKIKQILLFLLYIQAHIAKPETFYQNFHTLMEKKQEKEIDISGFYFPTINNTISINTSHSQLRWNNIIIWQNIKGYNIEYIETVLIKRIIISRVLQPIINNLLTNIYRDLQSNDLTIPDVQDHIFNNNLSDDKIAEHIPYESLEDINIKDIFDDNNNIDEIFQGILAIFIKNIDIENILRPNHDITQDTIKHIKSIIPNLSISQIKGYIHLDNNQGVNYKNISDEFYKLVNMLDNSAFTGDVIQNIKTEYEHIVFNQNMTILATDPYNDYILKNCEFNSPNIIITVNNLDFHKNKMSKFKSKFNFMGR